MNLSVNAKRAVLPLFWLVAAGLGYALTKNQSVVVTAAAVAVLLVLAALFKPEQLLLLAAVMIPFRVVESLLPIARGGVTIADGFLLAFVVSAMARRRVVEGRKIPVVVVVVLVILVLVGIASIFNGGYYGVGVRKVGRIAVVGLAFLAASRSLVFRDAEKVAAAFVLSAGASSIVALGFTLRAAAVPGVGVLRLWGGVEDPNHMSVVIAVGFLIALSWRPKYVPGWLWLTSALLMLVAQVASLSRGGGAAFAVGLGVLVLLTVYARFFGRQMGLWTRSGALLVLLASAAALGAAFLPADIAGSAAVRYQGILNPTTDATGAFRLRLWDAGYRMLAQSPFLGVGPGAFGLALVASGAFSVPWEAHSSLVEIAVETGYVGLLVVGLALVVGALYSAAAFNAASRDGSVEIGRVALASGLMASAAAIVTGGFSLSNILYQPLFATTIVLLIATLARQEPAQ